MHNRLKVVSRPIVWHGASLSELQTGATGTLKAEGSEGVLASVRLRIEDNSDDPEIAAAAGVHVTCLQGLSLTSSRPQEEVLVSLRDHISSRCWPRRATFSFSELDPQRDAALRVAGWRLDSCVSRASKPPRMEIAEGWTFPEFEYKHFDGVVRLYREYAQSISALSPFAVYGHSAENHFINRLSGRQSGAESDSYLKVAFDENRAEVVGVIEFSFDEVDASENKTACNIHWIATASRLRGSGIGSALVQSAVYFRPAVDLVETAYLTTTDGPISFWDGLGFQPFWFNFEYSRGSHEVDE